MGTWVFAPTCGRQTATDQYDERHLIKDVLRVFDDVDRDFGEPDLVVFNAGAFQKNNVLDIDPADFERCWRIGCLGGLLVGQAAARRMIKRGHGTIILRAQPLHCAAAPASPT